MEEEWRGVRARPNLSSAVCDLVWRSGRFPAPAMPALIPHGNILPMEHLPAHSHRRSKPLKDSPRRRLRTQYRRRRRPPTAGRRNPGSGS